MGKLDFRCDAAPAAWWVQPAATARASLVRRAAQATCFLALRQLLSVRHSRDSHCPSRAWLRRPPRQLRY
jgi:hypothetical protein